MITIADKEVGVFNATAIFQAYNIAQAKVVERLLDHQVALLDFSQDDGTAITVDRLLRCHHPLLSPLLAEFKECITDHNFDQEKWVKLRLSIIRILQAESQELLFHVTTYVSEVGWGSEESSKATEAWQRISEIPFLDYQSTAVMGVK